MAIKSGRVGVSPDSVTPEGKVKTGGLTPEQTAKLDKALVTPVTQPVSNELVGVGTANEQIRVVIGDGLELDGGTSPYTLKTAGGGGGGSDWTLIDEVICNFNNKITIPETAKEVRITVIGRHISSADGFITSADYNVNDLLNDHYNEGQYGKVALPVFFDGSSSITNNARRTEVGIEFATRKLFCSVVYISGVNSASNSKLKVYYK